MRVAEDQGWLTERADEVLARRKINRRLSADGGIDLRQKRRRNLDKANPAKIRRRRKSRHIARHAAAQRDDKPLAGDVPRGKGVQNLGVDREVLDCSPCGKVKLVTSKPASCIEHSTVSP